MIFVWGFELFFKKNKKNARRNPATRTRQRIGKEKKLFRSKETKNTGIRKEGRYAAQQCENLCRNIATTLSVKFLRKKVALPKSGPSDSEPGGQNGPSKLSPDRNGPGPARRQADGLSPSCSVHIQPPSQIMCIKTSRCKNNIFGENGHQLRSPGRSSHLPHLQRGGKGARLKTHIRQSRSQKAKEATSSYVRGNHSDSKWRGADADSPFPATSDSTPASPPASACTSTLPFAIDAFYFGWSDSLVCHGVANAAMSAETSASFQRHRSRKCGERWRRRQGERNC